ncbi:MAG: HD domain-containing protein [Clostridia bacterium]|nr:HD domain-containing protein [Clostridia bacterium]
MRLEEIDKNGTLQGFVLVKTCDRKSAKNGSTYLDLIITDGESDVVAKIWDFKGEVSEQPAVGTLIRVRGTLSIYNGQPQFKIDRFRAVNDADNVNISDFVPSATFSGEEMFDEIVLLADKFEDAELKKLTLSVLDEYKSRILELPAAFKLHHAVRGGLMMHTLSLCRLAEAVSLLYPSVDKDLLLCGAILHDIAKSEEFNLAPTGLVDGYTARGTLVGHLVGGAMLVNEIGKRESISDETLMLVEHMLISHHGIPEYGAAVRPLFLEAEILSSLDTFDANIFEIENALKDIEAGSFTNRMWALDDRKFYNHGRKKIVTDVNLIIKNSENEEK